MGMALFGEHETAKHLSGQLKYKQGKNSVIIPRSKRRRSQTLVVPPNDLCLYHSNSLFVLHTQTANRFGYVCTVMKTHSTIVAVIMNTTMEN